MGSTRPVLRADNLLKFGQRRGCNALRGLFSLGLVFGALSRSASFALVWREILLTCLIPIGSTAGTHG